MSKGLKGFAKSKYDPEVMGEFILENLLGLDNMDKLSDEEKERYKKEKYPIVMTFFATHDLQPTLHNLRLNKQAIIDFASPTPNAVKSESNYTGLLGEVGKRGLTGADALRAFVLIFILVLILKVL